MEESQGRIQTQDSIERMSRSSHHEVYPRGVDPRLAFCDGDCRTPRNESSPIIVQNAIRTKLEVPQKKPYGLQSRFTQVYKPNN